MKKFFLIALLGLYGSSILQSQTLDSQFGNEGFRILLNDIIPFASVKDMKVLPNGKILVLVLDDGEVNVGDDNEVFAIGSAVTLLNPDGSTDLSFNGTGHINLANFSGTCLYLLPDNKFLVGGARIVDAGTRRSAMLAFNLDGSSDNRFINNSNLAESVSFPNGVIKEIQQRADGKFWAFGYFMNGSNGYDYQALRFNSDGTLDTSYDGNGIAVYNSGPNYNDRANGSIMIDDDNFLLYGYTKYTQFSNPGSVGRIVGFLDDGEDNSLVAQEFFTNAGTAWNNRSGYNDAVNADNYAFYVGLKLTGSNRLQPILTVCETFEFDDEIIRQYDDINFIGFPTTGVDAWFSQVEQNVNGKIIIAGHHSLMENNTEKLMPFIYKRLANTMVDPDNPNPVNIDLGYDCVFINKLVMQPDGKYLIAGTALNYIDALNDFWFNLNPAVHTFRHAFIARIEDGCTAQAMLQSIINSCEGETLTLNPGIFSSYQWSTGATSPTIEVTSNGVYTVSVTDADGCIGSATAQVTFHPHPETPVITQNGTTLSASGSGTFTWYFNGDQIIGETSNTIIINQTGTYIVQLTSSEICSSTSSSFDVTVLNIGNYPAQNRIFPNPSQGIIALDGFAENIMVEIYDLTGKLELRQRVSSPIIDIGLLSDGLYLLRLLQANKLVHEEKIVLSR